MALDFDWNLWGSESNGVGVLTKPDTLCVEHHRDYTFVRGVGVWAEYPGVERRYNWLVISGDEKEREALDEDMLKDLVRIRYGTAL